MAEACIRWSCSCGEEACTQLCRHQEVSAEHTRAGLRGCSFIIKCRRQHRHHADDGALINDQRQPVALLCKQTRSGGSPQKQRCHVVSRAKGNLCRQLINKNNFCRRLVNAGLLVAFCGQGQDCSAAWLQDIWWCCCCWWMW